MFGHHITPFAYRTAVIGHFIIGPAVAVVKTVLFDEFDAVQRQRQPFRAFLDFGIGAGVQQHLPSKLAYVLVGVQHLAVSPEIVVESPVHPVRRMGLPERNDVVDQFVTVAVDVRLEFLFSHLIHLSFGHVINCHRCQI